MRYKLYRLKKTNDYFVTINLIMSWKIGFWKLFFVSCVTVLLFSNVVLYKVYFN